MLPSKTGPITLILSLLLTSSAWSSEIRGAEYFQPSELSEKQREALKAVVVAITWETLETAKENSDSYDFEIETFQQKVNLCPTEKFKNEPSFGFCSGSFVGKSEILTAAHCSFLQTSSLFWINDFGTHNILGEAKDGKVLVRIPKANIFSTKKILKTTADNFAMYGWNGTYKEDYAVLSVAPLHTGITTHSFKPLTISKEQPYLNQKVISIGHPAGIPLKASIGTVEKLSGLQMRAFEKEGTNLKWAFSASTSVLAGNSGGPLLDYETLQIIGVASSKNGSDYEMKENCNEIVQNDNAELHWVNYARARNVVTWGLTRKPVLKQ